MSPHQTTPSPQSDVGEHAHTSFQLSHPPNITSLIFHADLVVKPMDCHMHVLPQPLSSCSVDPLDCTVLCSSIPESTHVVNEDQAINRVGVAQPTCAVICDPKHQPVVKDDSLPSMPPPLFLDIFGDFIIPNFARVSPLIDAPIVDHSQNTPDVSPSFDNGEENSFIEHPPDSSSAFSRNAEGECSCFSSTPLCDSSNHEDANKHLEFSYLGCCDPLLLHPITMLIQSLLICLRH